MRRLLKLLGFLPMLCIAWALVEASQGIWRSSVALGLVDPARFAEYRLYTAGPNRFAEEIETAIADRDYAYASSLYRLATTYGHELPPDLKVRAEGTWAERTYASGARAAGGFLFGSLDSGEAIAGSVASDLVGVGDVRDFSVQGFNYLAGRDYDPLLLGISTLGLGLTVASYGSLGATAAPDAGLSLVKNAYRGGKLSRPLAAYFARSAGKVVNPAVLKAELKAVATDGLPTVRRLEGAAAKSVDRVAARSLMDDVAVLDDMRRTGGVRTSVAALSLADGPLDLRRLQRVSSHFGDGSHAVMKFFGRSVLRAGYAFAELIYAVAAFAGMLFLAFIRWPLRILVGFAMRRLGFGAVAVDALRPVIRMW